MITFAAHGHDDQGDIVVLGFGLSAENVTRMQEGKPVVFSMAIDGIRTRIMIFYGDTEKAMVAELQEMLGPDTQMTGEF